MSQIAQYDQIENPYSSTATLEPAADASESELRAFVGPRSDFYLRKWAPRLADSSGDCGMNWAAFFLTSFWLAYRKMYAATFVYYAAIILLMIAEQFVFVVLIGSAVPGAVGLIVNLLVCLVCGLYGNAWYLAHTRGKIAAARKQGLQDEPLLIHLMNRGGTSLLSAFGLNFLISMVLGIAVAIVVIAAVAARGM